MENRAIPDSSIRADGISAFDTLPSDARLGTTAGWCYSEASNPYLKVDLKSPHFICAIATQGGLDEINRVKYIDNYTIELAIKDFQGEYYKENGTIKVFYFKYKRVMFLNEPIPIGSRKRSS